MTSVRRVDDSMSLLRTLVAEAIDPDYARGARGPHHPRGKTPFVVVVVLIGMLFSIAAIQTTRSRPANAAERTELINRLTEQKRIQDKLRATILQRQSEVRGLENEELSQDHASSELAAELAIIEPVTGAIAVSGPGLVITVDDAADGNQHVVDTDLQQLANGLWEAGAEAVAINGHRLTTRSAIRGAGEAITVDYRSLTRPYLVQAIGDPATLGERFTKSRGGQWWAAVTQKYGLELEMKTAAHISLSASPALRIRHAEVKS